MGIDKMMMDLEFIEQPLISKRIRKSKVVENTQ